MVANYLVIVDVTVAKPQPCRKSKLEYCKLYVIIVIDDECIQKRIYSADESVCKGSQQKLYECYKKR